MVARPLSLRVAPVKARSARWSAAAVSAAGLGAMARSVNQLDRIPGLATKSQESKLAQNIVLQIDLTDNTEGIQDLKVVEALRYAGTDDRVQGLVMQVGSAGLATIQELREAVSDFRKAKQDAVPTVAYAVAYNTSSYYLASAFDQVFAQDGTLFNFVGFVSEQVFIKRLLKKLKVTVNVFSREQYKNAHNDVVKTGHPPAVRRAIRAMLERQLEQVVEGVAKDKGLSFSQVMAAVNAAPFPVEDAVKQGFITGTKYSADATHDLKIIHKFLPGETSSNKTKQELWEFYQRVAQAEAKPLSFDIQFCWVTKIFSASGIWDRRRCQIVSLPEYSSAMGAERMQKQREAGVLEQEQPVVLLCRGSCTMQTPSRNDDTCTK